MQVGPVTVLVDQLSSGGSPKPKRMLFRKKLPSGKVLSTQNPVLGKVWLSEAMEERKKAHESRMPSALINEQRQNGVELLD